MDSPLFNVLKGFLSVSDVYATLDFVTSLRKGKRTTACDDATSADEASADALSPYDRVLAANFVRYEFSCKEHMGVDNCLHMRALNEDGDVIFEHTLSQSTDIHAFQGEGQDAIACSVKEIVQNAQDAILSEVGTQQTGQMGDGMGASLAVLFRNGVQIHIEVTRNVSTPFHFSVEARTTEIVVKNVTRKCFEISSMVNGSSDKKDNRVVSAAPSIFETLMRHMECNAHADDVKRCETRVTLRFPHRILPAPCSFWFLEKYEHIFDVVRCDAVHIQAKFVEGHREFRLFEAGLYVEDEIFAGTLGIHLNVTRRGARASTGRDRTFKGFDAVDFLNVLHDGAKKLATHMMPHIETLGPRAISLLSRLSDTVDLGPMWPSNVVPLPPGAAVERVLPLLSKQMRLITIRDDPIRRAFDNQFLYSFLFSTATRNDFLTSKAYDCVVRVGGHAPIVWMLPICQEDLETILREMPCKSVRSDAATASMRSDDKLYVCNDFLPDLISAVLMAFQDIRLFDVLRKTFDMTSLENGRLYAQDSKMSARSLDKGLEDDYFTPFLPVACGTSVEMKPTGGKMIYVKSAMKISPSEATAIISSIVRIPSNSIEISPCAAVARRCHTAAELAREIESREYGSCILSDMNDVDKPIQCMARSIMYVLMMRYMGYDAILLRGDTHALAMLQTHDAPICVECTFSDKDPLAKRCLISPDDDFAFLYLMFKRMTQRVGREKGHELLSKFCEMH